MFALVVSSLRGSSSREGKGYVDDESLLLSSLKLSSKIQESIN